MQVNIGELSEIFGVARSTISAWVLDGMPFVEKGNTGKAWTFDTLECVEWWGDNKFRPKNTAPTFDAAGNAVETIEEADRRKMVAGADLAELNNARAAGIVIEIADSAAAIAEMHRNVATRLLGIPNKVRLSARSHFGDDRAAAERVVAVVDEVVSEAMAEIRDDPFGDELVA